jgi:hypothetical protein
MGAACGEGLPAGVLRLLAGASVKFQAVQGTHPVQGATRSEVYGQGAGEEKTMTGEALLEQVRNTRAMAYRERISQYGDGHVFTSDVLRDCVTLLDLFEQRLSSQYVLRAKETP